MSINWEQSAELNNMTVDGLKARFERFPRSAKKVVAVCDSGNNCLDRIIPYYAYRDLCNSCSKIRRYEDPNERRKTGEANKKRYEDPDERIKTGESVKKAHRDDPTLSQRLSDGQKKSYQDDKTRAKRQRDSQRAHYTEMIDPGLEICSHHVAYDFARPEALTVDVTRRFHGSIHNPKGTQRHLRGYSLID